MYTILKRIWGLSVLYGFPVGKVTCAEETVHTDHPAGPKGEGELPEGEDQPADDAAAGER